MEPDGHQRQRSTLPDDLIATVAEPLLALLTERVSRAQRPVLLVNGPVGAGKSTLALGLRALAPRYGLRLAVASIDDAYRTLQDRLTRLEGNPFGVTRVPPGSHDPEALRAAIQAWRSGDALRLPRFDKTLAAGQGDRCGHTQEEADALILEGWLNGCRPLGAAGLAAARWKLASWPLSEQERAWLPHWDRELEAYQSLWQCCDGLWILRPERWTLPLRWRFQAEARQRRAGGGWLPAADLERLVRASLNALPPPLYQDPLLQGGATGIPLLGVTVLDGRRRCRLLEAANRTRQASDSSLSSAMG